MWTSMMFDMAVLVYGRHIEGKLSERDEDGRLVNTIRDLLDLPLDKTELREQTLLSLRMLDFEARKPRSGIVIE